MFVKLTLFYYRAGALSSQAITLHLWSSIKAKQLCVCATKLLYLELLDRIMLSLRILRAGSPEKLKSSSPGEGTILLLVIQHSVLLRIKTREEFGIFLFHHSFVCLCISLFTVS